MKIFSSVIQPVSINVMDDFSRLRSSNLAMLPLLTVVPFCAGCPNSLSVKRLTVSAVCFFGACSSRLGWSQFRIRGDFVTSPHVLSWRKTVNFFRVGVERITMSVPHLVVPHTHITSSNWSFAVKALTANNLAAPRVINRAVFFHALVVHQAKTMSVADAAVAERDELMAALQRIADGQEMSGVFTFADVVLRYQEIARAVIARATGESE